MIQFSSHTNMSIPLGPQFQCSTRLVLRLTRLWNIGMIKPVLLVYSFVDYSLSLALAKHSYIYELSPPPYWLVPLLADVCHIISLYRMTYAIGDICPERLLFNMYTLFSNYLISLSGRPHRCANLVGLGQSSILYNNVYDDYTVQCIGCSNTIPCLMPTKYNSTENTFPMKASQFRVNW